MDVYARRGCRHDRPMPNGREELEDGETLASMMIRCILLLKCYTAAFSRERVLYLSHRSLPGTTSARVYERLEFVVSCVVEEKPSPANLEETSGLPNLQAHKKSRPLPLQGKPLHRRPL